MKRTTFVMNGRSFIILLVAIIAVSFCIGGFIGYQYTIKHQQIEVDGNTALVSLFNRVDAYDIEADDAEYQRGFHDGQRSGYIAGTDAGFNDGYVSGRNEGYSAGYNAGVSKSNAMYQAGISAGYSNGYNDGYYETIVGLDIETDGDGDSAIVTVGNHEYLVGINGYVLDEDGTVVFDLETNQDLN